MPRASIVHVGVNKSHGFLGPIFGDGSFRFIPLHEKYPSQESWKYENLGLSKWTPTDWVYAHYDPEFRTYTWGDHKNKRTFCTRQLSKGDFVFFIASLAYNQSKRVAREPWVSDYGMYVIGYFELKEIPQEENISYPIPLELKRKYVNNAHVKRDYTKYRPPSFLIFKGSENSRPLNVAIPFSCGSKPNELARKAIPNVNPKKPRWWSDTVVMRDGVEAIFHEISKRNRL